MSRSARSRRPGGQGGAADRQSGSADRADQQPDAESRTASAALSGTVLAIAAFGGPSWSGNNAMRWQRLVSIGAGCLGVVLAGLLTQSATAKPDDASTVVCFDSDFYREQATRFRQLAAVDLTSQMAGLAAAYDAKAARIEASTDDPCTPFWAK
jgi:hypothetical protein